MMPSAPVYSSTCFASSGVVMSPFATTGKRVDRLTSRIVSYSARPEKPQARVRPCKDNSCTPLSSAILATFRAFLLPVSHPVRNFSVTGTFTAFTTALRIRSTRGSSLRSADPARVLQTFFAGQPMLMSTICAPRSTLKRAASAIMTGSAPAICTEIGSTKRLLRKLREPIRIDDHGNFFERERNSIPKHERLGKRSSASRNKKQLTPDFLRPRGAETVPCRSGQRASAEDHAMGEKAPRRRQGIERGQARTAGQRERRKRIREYSHQKIGEPDSAVAVETAATGVAREKPGCANFFLCDIKQHLSQFPRVAQAEIESLAGHRVQRLRGVSDRKNPRCGSDRAMTQGKREG